MTEADSIPQPVAATLPRVAAGICACLAALTGVASLPWHLHTPPWLILLLATATLAAAAWAWPRPSAVVAPVGTGLGSAAVIVTYLWSLYSLLTHEHEQLFAAAAIAAAVMVVGQAIRTRSPLDGAPDLPWWLAGLLLVVCVGSLVTWTVAEDLGTGVLAAIAGLVCSTPGALLVAASEPLRVGFSRGRRIGFRIEDTEVLDAAHLLDRVVLDKERTITTGDLAVIGVRPVDPEHDRNLRWFAGALEHASDTPIGHAVARLSGAGRLTSVVQLPGHGISGSVDRHPVRVGDPSWLGTVGPDEVGEALGVEVDGRVLGHLLIADEIRQNADRPVHKLVRMGLTPLLVCDGDPDAAARLAKKSGIEELHTGLDGPSRARLVRGLQEDGHAVMVVGDVEANGEALACADLAVSRRPTGARRQILLSDLDTSWVATALTLCRSMRRRIRVNRVLALGGMLVPLPFCAAGVLPAWGSALVAVAALGTAMLNSLLVP